MDLPSYDQIIARFGDVVIKVEDDDYQGDTRVLYRHWHWKDGRDVQRIGYLRFGWGSCSGCDALQACTSEEEVEDLINELRSSIKWFDSKEEALEFFENHDWKGDYSYRMKGQLAFVNAVKAYLKGMLS